MPAKLEDIVIVGAGGFAREVAYLLDAINDAAPTWNLLGFTAPDAEAAGEIVGGRPIVGRDDVLLARSEELAVVIGVGTPAVIRKVAAQIRTNPALRFPNLMHPATLWHRDRVQFGKGNIICAGNIFTTDIRIGSFNIINLSCTIGHDVVIGDHCVINPGSNISGGVAIGNDVLIGTGATILQNRMIGDGAVVGAGAVVTRDVPAGVTVVGSPARPLERKPLEMTSGAQNR